jgi:hypothetical protein
MMERLKGHTEIIRLLEMIRSCFCITVNFYKHLSAKAEKKPKGNGIKDGLVCRVCVYAVVFWFFFVRSVRRAAVAIFAV